MYHMLFDSSLVFPLVNVQSFKKELFANLMCLPSYLLATSPAQRSKPALQYFIVAPSAMVSPCHKLWIVYSQYCSALKLTIIRPGVVGTGPITGKHIYPFIPRPTIYPLKSA